MLFLPDAKASELMEGTIDDTETIEEEMPEVSVLALFEYTSPQAMRVHGCIKRHPVVILIDSGSTHNFVDPKVAKDIGCHMQANEPFNVMVENGGNFCAPENAKIYDKQCKVIDFIRICMSFLLEDVTSF